MKLITILMLLVLMVGCSAPDEPIVAPELPETNDTSDNESLPIEPATAEPGSDITTGDPVETKSPNTDYQPAFTGQTRIGSVTTQAELSIDMMTEDLTEPWAITTAPDGRFFITEKAGNLRILSDGVLSAPITGFPEIDSAGQGGLLDVALSPSFETDRRVYFSFSHATGEGSATAVGYGILNDTETALEDFTIIYEALPYYSGNGHYGSRIVFAADGSLFVSTGDRQSSDTRMRAQSLDNGYGKVIHLDRDGNPVEALFPDLDGALPEIYSYGHRNVQGMDIDPRTGELWIAEMGPQGGDELNLILPGKNYGWPLVSYGEEYSGAKISDGQTQLEGTEQPVYYWDPVIAPAGMVFYTGDLMEEWQNNLFIGGLRGSHIVRLVIEDRRVVGEERLLEDLGERFRDVTVGQDGALYNVTDSGKLYRIGFATN